VAKNVFVLNFVGDVNKGGNVARRKGLSSWFVRVVAIFVVGFALF
jgi:hypothetical protein